MVKISAAPQEPGTTLTKAYRRSFWLLSGGSALGSIIGLGTFLLLARFLGAGAASDAFFLVRRFVQGLDGSIERAGRQILVPSMIRRAASGEGTEVRLPSAQLLLGALGAGLLAGAGLFFFAGEIVRWLAPGFDREHGEIAARLMRIIAPMIPLTVAATIALSYLNAARKFGFGGLVTQVPRLVLFLAILLMPTSVEMLAGALLLGTAIYALIIAVPLLRLYLRRRREAKKQAASGGTGATAPGRRLGIVLIAQIEVQGVVWIDAAFASLIGIGALSTLEYGQRLMALAPTLLSTSLISVAFTEMAHAAAVQDKAGFARSVAHVIRSNVFLILPLSVVTAGNADLLVSILLLHGQFSAKAAADAIDILRYGLPHMVFVAINGAVIAALTADGSRSAGRILAIGITVMLVSRVAIFAVVTQPFGLAGLILGSAGSLCLGTICLLVLLQRHCGGLLKKRDLSAFAGFALAAAIGALGLLAVRLVLTDIVPDGPIGELLLLAASSAAAGSLYLGLTILGKARELELLGLGRRLADRQKA